MNILVLDDEPAVLWAFAQIFSGTHTTVYTARNGAEGLAIVSKRKMALIFCDVHMPVMCGIKFAYQLREDPATVDLPLVLMSETRTADHEQTLLECRAMDLIEKPLDTALIRSLAAEIEKLQHGRVHEPASEAKRLRILLRP
jgi:CheY-like chemotaxis protein